MCVYLCQPAKVANLARGQLNRRNGHFPVPVRPGEFDLVIRVRPSRPASACSFSILRLNLVLTHGIPPDFRVGVHSLILTTIRHRGSPEFIESRSCEPMRPLPRVCRHRANSPHNGSSNRGCLCISMDQLTFVILFPHPLMV